jgi:hypothetical protein
MATYVSLSDFANVTMEEWQRTVPNHINHKYWLNNNLKTRVVNHGGESLINVPFQSKGMVSAMPTAENVANPTPVSPSYGNLDLYMKKIVARMILSEETMALNKGKAAIVDNLNRLMTDTLNDYNMMREFQMHQPADGVICVSAESDTATTITMDSVRWVRPNMTLDGFQDYSDTTADHADAVVSSVDYDTKVVTFSASLTSTTDGEEFVIANTYTAGAINTTYFCNGIETLINNDDPDYGDIMGRDRATYPDASAVVKTGASAGTAEALTLARMRSVLDSIDVWWGNDLPNIIYCPVGVYNSYLEILRNANQPTVSMPAKDGYPAGVEFIYNGKSMRIVSSRLALPNTMFFINTDHLIKYKAADTGWDTLAGPWEKISGYQQYEKVYRGWENYAVDVFKSHGRLEDITETT